MPHTASRRDFLTGALSLPVLSLLPQWASGALAGGTPPRLGPAEAFDFDRLAARAKALAARPYAPYPIRNPRALDRIDYDAHWKIRFRSEKALWQGGKGPYKVSMFHLGRYQREPVRLHLVADGTAREVLYSRDFFAIPPGSPALDLPGDSGFAGFRMMNRDGEGDWLAFLGASYFRSACPFNQYGLSARGLAIDTAMPQPEEFPRFSQFWLAPDVAGSDGLWIHALLEGPSVTGAYAMRVRHSGHCVMDITAKIYPRKPVARLGIAPLTSMFWFSESNRQAATEWRPEVHDSDGLAIWSGAGERLWRPLNNPPTVKTSSFADSTPKGFGLMQRDRDFNNYQDDGVFYDKRPSLWVEPTSDWGRGAVQLVEIPTDDEIHDNIVAYWTPADPVRAGAELSYSYLLHWVGDEPYPPRVARVVATRTGAGGVPGQPRPGDRSKFVIDFEGGRLDELDRDSGVRIDVTAPRGLLSNLAAYNIVGTKRWRAVFDYAPLDKEAVDLRCYLRLGNEPLSETWLGQYIPA